MNNLDAAMKILPTCQDVTRLVLESQDHALPPLARLQMRLHWLMCDRCRHFRKQAALMRQAMRGWRAYRDGDGG